MNALGTVLTLVDCDLTWVCTKKRAAKSLPVCCCRTYSSKTVGFKPILLTLAFYNQQLRRI